MWQQRFLFSIIICNILWSSALAAAPVFRLHLSNEPSHLNPQIQKSSSASYLVGNLHRNLLRYDNEKGLVPDLAKVCYRKTGLLINCQLHSHLKWSDGTPLIAQDFIRAYASLLDPKTKAPRADLLFSIRNAEDIFKSRKSKNSLGVKAVGRHTLEFTLSSADPDFEHVLTSVITSPEPPDKKELFSGPYQVAQWKRGQSLRLKPNNNYVPQSNSKRPDVEFLFISEDSVALKLYEKSELSFLRRLPTLYIPKFKSRPDFHWVSMLRMDYVGFGPKLSDQLALRKVLSESLKYEELQKVFSSEGRPGCSGLPASWFESKKDICYEFTPVVSKSSPLTLLYSAMGGEDHKRATEWMQNQWKLNAGLDVRLNVQENKVFLETLKNAPPELFRKGHALDRPTCLAAVEVFQSHHPENYIQLKSEKLDKAVLKLKQDSGTLAAKKSCQNAVQILLDEYHLIPLGAIHFAMLVKPDFQGWKINQMNQLDLSELQFKP